MELDDGLWLVLDQPPDRLGQRINRKTIETMAILSQKCNHPLLPPQIVYDLRGRTAGQAIGGRKVRLNLQLLLDPRFQENMIEQTLPHELAHIAVRQLFPHAKSHGREWQAMMRLLGLPAERCHNYETTPARVKKKYATHCDCKTHPVTITIIRRMRQGTPYFCRNCGAQLQEGRYE